MAHLHRLGIPITAVALPWILRAFVGFLPVEEVLLLWDRVIGLDSLLPVALLAAAVLCFRRQVGHLISFLMSHLICHVYATSELVDTPAS